MNDKCNATAPASLNIRAMNIWKSNWIIVKLANWMSISILNQWNLYISSDSIINIWNPAAIVPKNPIIDKYSVQDCFFIMISWITVTTAKSNEPPKQSISPTNWLRPENHNSFSIKLTLFITNLLYYSPSIGAPSTSAQTIQPTAIRPAVAPPTCISPNLWPPRAPPKSATPTPLQSNNCQLTIEVYLCDMTSKKLASTSSTEQIRYIHGRFQNGPFKLLHANIGMNITTSRAYGIMSWVVTGNCHVALWSNVHKTHFTLNNTDNICPIIILFQTCLKNINTSISIISLFPIVIIVWSLYDKGIRECYGIRHF